MYYSLCSKVNFLKFFGELFLRLSLFLYKLFEDVGNRLIVK